MKTRFYFIIALGLLFSCAKKESPNLKFMIWGDPAEIKVVKGYIKNFEDKNPGEKIDLIAESPSGYDEKLQALLLNRNAPDVVYVSREWFRFYAKSSQLVDLSPYIEKDSDFNFSDFYPEVKDSFLWDNKYFALAKDFTPLVLYYNKDLFKKEKLKFPSKNWTWKDFLETAKKLTRDTDSDGMTDQWGFAQETWFLEIAPWLWQSGTEIYDEKEMSFPFVQGDNAKKTVDTLSFLFDLMHTYKVSPGPEITKKTGAMNIWASGKAGMCTYGRWAVMSFKDIKGFEWDVSYLPKGEKQATPLMTVGYGITQSSRKKDLAWRLVKFLLSTENQADVAASGQAIPVRMSIAKSPYFLNTPKLDFKIDSMIFLESLQFAKYPPMVPEWNEAGKLIDDNIALLFNKAVSPEKCVADIEMSLRKFNKKK